MLSVFQGRLLNISTLKFLAFEPGDLFGIQVIAQADPTVTKNTVTRSLTRALKRVPFGTKKGITDIEPLLCAGLILQVN